MSLPLRIARSLLARPDTRHRYGEDPSQVADLHVPRGPGPFRVVVVIHGGSWEPRFGRLTTRPIALDLVDRGWAAWNLEYRRVGPARGGGGGWPQTFEDIAAGIDALGSLGDPRLDVASVDVVGHSAGGQLALYAGAPETTRAVPVRRVAGLAAVSNLGVAGATAHALMGGGPAQVPERYAIADPLRRVPLPIPVLLVHATDDRSVPAKRSREYVAASRAAGGEAELVEVATGGHRAPIDPPSEAWQAAAGWLDAEMQAR